MTVTHSDIRDYFISLDLTSEIADLYISLQKNGPQTISELSRNANIERTRIYRLLKQLQLIGLIEIESKYKRNVIAAAPLSNLQILLDQKESHLRTLRDKLPHIQQSLASNPSSSPTTRVQYYQGAQGLRQMLWNELRASTEI